MNAYQWACADRIAEQIIAVLNAEREKPDFSPAQAVLGQLTALVSILLRTPPDATSPRMSWEMPECIKDLVDAAKVVAYEIGKLPDQSGPSG